MKEPSLDALVSAIEHDLPAWKEWSGGYPDEIEVALIDAVLSIRARYGGPDSGVRAAIRRYRRAHGEAATLDFLDRLAGYDPTYLVNVLEVRQQTSGVPKAEAIVNAARSLNLAGVQHADDVDPVAHKRAYTQVHGLGWVTWDYFTMLVGHPGIKSDTWITRWVSKSSGLPDGEVLSSEDAHAALTDAARQLGIATTRDGGSPNLTHLDHAIWAHARWP